MKQIWKYELEMIDNQAISMPRGSEIVAVQDQCGSICIWALVDTLEGRDFRFFDIIGTGHPIHDHGHSPAVTWCRNHVGTVQQSGGALVWHVFERVPMTVPITS